MKRTITKTITEEVDVKLPYYSKSIIGYYLVLKDQDNPVFVKIIKGRESIEADCLANALNEENEPSSKEEFESAFESTLTIIKNKVYAR